MGNYVHLVSHAALKQGSIYSVGGEGWDGTPPCFVDPQIDFGLIKEVIMFLCCSAQRSLNFQA